MKSSYEFFCCLYMLAGLHRILWMDFYESLGMVCSEFRNSQLDFKVFQKSCDYYLFLSNPSSLFCLLPFLTFLPFLYFPFPYPSHHVLFLLSLFPSNSSPVIFPRKFIVLCKPRTGDVCKSFNVLNAGSSFRLCVCMI